MDLAAALRGADDLPSAADAVVAWLEQRGAAECALLVHDGVASMRVAASRGTSEVLDAIPADTLGAAATRPGVDGEHLSVPVTIPARHGTEVVGVLRVRTGADAAAGLTADARKAAERLADWWMAARRSLPSPPGRDLARFTLAVLADTSTARVHAGLLAEALRVTGCSSGAVVSGVPTPHTVAVHGPAADQLARLPEQTLTAVFADMPGRIRHGGQPLVDGMQAQLIAQLDTGVSAPPATQTSDAILLVDPEPRSPSPLSIEHLDLLAGIATTRLTQLRESTELARAEAHFRGLVEQAADLICTVDDAGHLSYVNPSCREVLGYAPDELAQRPAEQLLHSDDRPLVVQLMRDVLAGLRDTVRITHRISHSQGHVVWLESVATARPGEAEAPAQLQIIARDVSQSKAEADRLGRLATRDDLTGLSNRSQLLLQLRRSLTTAPASTAVLFVDLDDFKPINDQFGHAFGDQLLVQVAARLRHATRPGDLVARFGGDEFVVLCSDIQHPRTAERIAARILEALEEPFALGDLQLIVSASIGVAQSSAATPSAEALLAEADAAMYRAKTTARGGYALSQQPPTDR